MPLPYRTILTFPSDTDLIALAERQLQEWIESARKIDAARRVGFTNGEFFAPGIHQLADGKQLQIVEADQREDGTRRRLFRFTERNAGGVWQVDVVAIDRHPSRRNSSDTLIVEARRLDDPDADGQVDPPGVIKLLLAEIEVRDSSTPVTPSAQFVKPADVSFVLEAINDPARTVSVVVAGAPDRDQASLSNFRAVVDSLTSKIIGTASVFVLSYDAVAVLNSRLPRSHQIDIGRVRTYMPGVDLTYPADGLKHRVLGPLTLSRALRQKNKVAPYLQQAFAQQTRGAQLKSPLSRDVQRNWAVLSNALADLAREELVRAKLVELEERRKEPEPETKAADQRSLGERLAGFLQRVLGVETHEARPEHIEALEQQWARLEAAADAIHTDLRRAEEKLSSKQEEFDDLSEEHEFRGLELADAERRAASLESEVRWLRQQLAESGSQVAFSQVPGDVWETPSDLDELILLLTPEVTDRPSITTHVVFVGDPKDVTEAHQQDRTGLDTQRIWDYVRVLHDYSVARSEGKVTANVHACLKSDTYDGYKVPDSRHVPIESAPTLNQWASERTFDIPELGPTLMPAHFRSGKWVRLYYHDDTGPGRTGKVYIGYIGMHLTNTKTRNM